MDLSHDPKAIALDFCMFTLAPDAASEQCIASWGFVISVGVVTKIVTSSAYATAEALHDVAPFVDQEESFIGYRGAERV